MLSFEHHAAGHEVPGELILRGRVYGGRRIAAVRKAPVTIEALLGVVVVGLAAPESAQWHLPRLLTTESESSCITSARPHESVLIGGKCRSLHDDMSYDSVMRP
jgi:hypothetical protein